MQWGHGGHHHLRHTRSQPLLRRTPRAGACTVPDHCTTSQQPLHASCFHVFQHSAMYKCRTEHPGYIPLCIEDEEDMCRGLDPIPWQVRCLLVPEGPLELLLGLALETRASRCIRHALSSTCALWGPCGFFPVKHVVCECTLAP